MKTMKPIQFLFAFLFLSYFSFAQNKFSESITKKEIKDHLYYLASDELEGRNSGEPGQKKAAEYIAKEYIKSSLFPISNSVDSAYFQSFNYNNSDQKTENVIGYIPADKKNAEWVVITAHYDHLGKSGDKIYNGADDNASGTTALLEIAEACCEAKKTGTVFTKNIMFIAFSAEELGLVGSGHFINSDIADSIKMMLNINMDMIGKSIRYGLIEAFKEMENTNFKEDTSYREDFVYLFHKGKQTTKFSKYAKKSARSKRFKIDQSPGLMMKLLYKSASDHKHFYDKGIPVMVFFTGLHPDYHTERDTADKIDYENLTIITKIIFETVFKIVTL